MTHDRFLQAVEGYYGAYPRAIQKEMVAQYVKTTYGEDDLETLLRQLLMTYSSQYRHTPDIEVMERTKRAWNDEHIASKSIGAGKGDYLALSESGESYLTADERLSAWDDIRGAAAKGGAA